MLAPTNKHNVVELSGLRRETRQQVLERLFQEHGAALRAFLRVRMGTEEDREDIVQDVFIRLARMDGISRRLPAASESARSFIIKVANNLLRDLERHRQTQKRYLEAHRDEILEEDIVELTPEQSAQSKRELKQAKAVIMSLKPRCRQVFVLHRFGNKSHREIAAKMRISIKQVEKYMSQATVKLRKAAIGIRGEE